MKDLRRYHHWLLAGLLLGTLVLAVVGCGGGESELTIQISELENSGQSGTAELVARGAQTEIIIKIKAGPPANDPQPTHVHFGACGPNVGTIRFNLNSLVAGESTTLIDASLASLTDGNTNLNIHKSLNEFAIFTACGDIPRR